MSPELRVQNLDHLGIIAGLIDELETVEQVNQHLGEDRRERISAGVAVKVLPKLLPDEIRVKNAKKVVEQELSVVKG